MERCRTMLESRRCKAGIAFAAVLMCAIMIGCAPSAPPPPPPPPPAPPPRALTVSPQRKQSQAQQNSDSAACQSQASAQATTSQEWAVIFTSCMSGRGYLVE